MAASDLTVWKRDRFARVIGIECPHCAHRIELRGKAVTDLEDGIDEVLGYCPAEPCRRPFSIALRSLGGYLWTPAS